jgi:poly-gamma-glutamate capsule biosynthesis protein CapA/YwtB (metallophosphatase superfamily)
MKKSNFEINNDHINVMAVGDIGLMGTVSSSINKKSSKGFFRDVIPTISKSHVFFGNLEIPFAKTNMKPVFNEIPTRLKSDPLCLDALKDLGIDIVCLANNHIMDYGIQGLRFTQELLRNKKIRYVGAGETLEEAIKPEVIQIHQNKIGFLAFAQEGAHTATSKRPGTAPINKDLIGKQIEILKDQVDWIIVSLHFGMMYTDYPKYDDYLLARWIIDKGANAVLGHHPHVTQGVENYNNGVIAYSLGEFIFDPGLGNIQSKHMQEIRKQTFIASLTLSKGNIELKTIPVLNLENRPAVCKDEKEADLVLKRIKKISLPLINYDIKFDAHVATRSVGHNFKVMLFNLKEMNFKYLLQRIVKIRTFHFKIIIAYLKNRV